MAGKKTEPAKGAARMEANELRFHVVQQGRRYSVQESAESPDTSTERGERTKVLQGSFATKDEADARAKFLADHYQGEVG